MLKKKSYAKINLFFYITGKREDGYHNIFSLMCKIDVYDEILINFKSDKLKVSCTDKEVGDDKKNIVYKAIEVFSESIKKKILCDVKIKKNIPVGAGLGGGSSNAGTTLLALNKYYGDFFSKEKLMEIGKKIGADVPFFIFGKPAIAEGIGEKLKVCKNLYPYKVVLAYPNINISTKTIYEKINLELTNNKKIFKQYSFAKNGFPNDFLKKNLIKLMTNDFEPLVFKMHPKIKRLKKYFLENGADASLMSGSGSSVFAIFEDSKIAEKSFLNLKSNYKVFLTKILI